MKKIFIILLIVFQTSLFAQTIGLGGSLIYNFQTESFGYSLRVKKTIKKYSIIPQLSYFPKNNFNKINELIIGFDLQYNVLESRDIAFYVLGNLGYNAWINHNDSYIENTQYSNWNADFGAGVMLPKCISPFIEFRYNIKWLETSINVGAVYFFKCRKKRKKIKIKTLPESENDGETIEDPEF